MTVRDARLWTGHYLDGFVYPTALAAAPTAEMLKLHGGRALLDDRELAGALLAQLTALVRAGPAPLAPDDAQMRRAWARKMLVRIGRDDLEGRYRGHWLLYQLLEDYFALRGAWYRGPKLAFAELRSAAPDVCVAFEHALAGGDIATLVELVAG